MNDFNFVNDFINDIHCFFYKMIFINHHGRVIKESGRDIQRGASRLKFN